MLLFVGVYVLLLESPGRAAGGMDVVAAVAVAFGSFHELLDLAIAAIGLAALAEHAHTIFVFELDGKMVIDMAVDLADPSLAALGPPGFLGRVSIWVKDVPLLALRAAILSASGLAERIEADHRFLERRPGNDDTLVPVARAVPDPQLVLRAQDLTVQEFDLAGLASTGDAWSAFAYTPKKSAKDCASWRRILHR